MVYDQYCHTDKTCDQPLMKKSIQHLGQMDGIIPVLQVRSVVVQLSKVIRRLLRRRTVKHAKETTSQWTGRVRIWNASFLDVECGELSGGLRAISGVSFLPVMFCDSGVVSDRRLLKHLTRHRNTDTTSFVLPSSSKA